MPDLSSAIPPNSYRNPALKGEAEVFPGQYQGQVRTPAAQACEVHSRVCSSTFSKILGSAQLLVV